VLTHTAIPLDKMRDQLRTVDQLRETLSVSEPLETYSFPLGNTAQFHIGEFAKETDVNRPVECYFDTPGGERYRLTQQSVLEAGSLAGIPRELLKRTPLNLIKPQLDYWYSGDAGQNSSVPNEVKVLWRPPVEGEGENPIAMAVTRATITPWSNLQILNAALAGIHEKYGAGAEVLVDYKLQHSLERTDYRLVVPGESRNITGTRVANDTWCTGINIRNSLTGIKQLRLDGYLFRWWCTNGSIDTLATAGALARRSVSDADQAYEWARASVDDVLGGLEESLDGVQQLAEIEVISANNNDGGQLLSTTLEQLFTAYGIPARDQQRIMAFLGELGGSITMYDIMQAITQAANLQDGSLSPRTIEQLLTLGGHVIHNTRQRCGPEHPCGRLLPENWQFPVPEIEAASAN
jgi:hypothetical protein